MIEEGRLRAICEYAQLIRSANNNVILVELNIFDAAKWLSIDHPIDVVYGDDQTSGNDIPEESLSLSNSYERWVDEARSPRSSGRLHKGPCTEMAT